jgi:DNA-binding response OmpR family regulator
MWICADPPIWDQVAMLAMAVTASGLSRVSLVRKAKMQAMVLDGNLDDCAAAVEHLRRAGYMATSVASVQEARDLLARSSYDLLLIELSPTDRSGLLLCSEIRDRFGYEPIIIFVGSETTAAQRALGLDLGADDVMSKPCDGDELLARIAARRRFGPLIA